MAARRLPRPAAQPILPTKPLLAPCTITPPPTKGIRNRAAGEGRPLGLQNAQFANTTANGADTPPRPPPFREVNPLQGSHALADSGFAWCLPSLACSASEPSQRRRREDGGPDQGLLPGLVHQTNPAGDGWGGSRPRSGYRPRWPREGATPPTRASLRRPLGAAARQHQRQRTPLRPHTLVAAAVRPHHQTGRPLARRQGGTPPRSPRRREAPGNAPRSRFSRKFGHGPRDPDRGRNAPRSPLPRHGPRTQGTRPLAPPQGVLSDPPNRPFPRRARHTPATAAGPARLTEVREATRVAASPPGHGPKGPRPLASKGVPPPTANAPFAAPDSQPQLRGPADRPEAPGNAPRRRFSAHGTRTAKRPLSRALTHRLTPATSSGGPPTRLSRGSGKPSLAASPAHGHGPRDQACSAPRRLSDRPSPLSPSPAPLQPQQRPQQRGPADRTEAPGGNALRSPLLPPTDTAPRDPGPRSAPRRHNRPPNAPFRARPPTTPHNQPQPAGRPPPTAQRPLRRAHTPATAAGPARQQPEARDPPLAALLPTTDTAQGPRPRFRHLGVSSDRHRPLSAAPRTPPAQPGPAAAPPPQCCPEPALPGRGGSRHHQHPDQRQRGPRPKDPGLRGLSSLAASPPTATAQPRTTKGPSLARAPGSPGGPGERLARAAARKHAGGGKLLGGWERCCHGRTRGQERGGRRAAAGRAVAPAASTDHWRPQASSFLAVQPHRTPGEGGGGRVPGGALLLHHRPNCGHRPARSPAGQPTATPGGKGARLHAPAGFRTDQLRATASSNPLRQTGPSRPGKAADQARTNATALGPARLAPRVSSLSSRWPDQPRTQL
ncbi:basic proline-rich protein-like [Penaeus indicus]|uniref:basic proline-rich protein-like n=1 Tax=Penaeus indicus TaxID=29960 RepID=UPI00300D8AD2